MGPDTLNETIEISRQQIEQLTGKRNWSTWKFRIMIMLRGVKNAFEIIDGRLNMPDQPAVGAADEAINQFRSELEAFNKAEVAALQILTSHMSTEILVMVMRFRSAREMWLELERLFDGNSEDRLYSLGMQFFASIEMDQEMTIHLSRLKTLFNDFNAEFRRSGMQELPEILLILKILNSLPKEYLSFVTSWKMLSTAERSIERLTTELCSFQRELKRNNKDQNELKQEDLAVNHDKKKLVNKSRVNRCFYCNEKGHFIRNCQKWIKDGKPSKSEKKSQKLREAMTVESFVSVTNQFRIEKESDWFVDNGATVHVTKDRQIFKEFREFNEKREIKTAKGNLEAVGEGTVPVEMLIKGRWHQKKLLNVWYVPNISRNLFSVTAAHDKNKDSCFVSRPTSCHFKINGRIVMVGNREFEGGLFKAALRTKSQTQEVNSLSDDLMLQLYHERMAHQNKHHVKKLIERELGIKVRADNETCEGCIYGKAHRLKFGTRVRATPPGELIHCDVCGPFEMPSFRGYRYFVLFKDDFSRYRRVYFMKEKSEVSSKLEEMLAEARTSGNTVKELLSDNGLEFDNEKVRKILQQHGVKQRLITPYTPQQNGCAERDNRTLVEAARAMLYAHSNLPKRLWAELVNTAAYIINRTGVSAVEGKSPFELWFGKKPSIKHLKVIGTTCYAYIPEQKRKKLDKKALKCVLIGYNGDDSYRLWHQESGDTKISRDVRFDKEVLLKSTVSTSISLEIDELHNSSQESNSIAGEDEMKEEVRDSDEPDEIQDLSQQSSSETGEDEIKELKNSETSISSKRELRDRSLIKQPARLEDYVLNAEGIEFSEISSLESRLSTVRSVLSVAARDKLYLLQFDVSTAFLYGDLEEDIYMIQPEGCDDGSGRVCHLKRSLCGLKQAPRCWNKKFNDFLTKEGFKSSFADPCLYIRNRNGRKLILVLYVDDGLIASSNKEDVEQFITDLKKSFQISCSEAKFYLGLEIAQEKDGIKITQKGYIEKILKKFNMENANPVETPIIKSSQNIEPGKAESKFPYRSAVGALMYLMVGTRPDIAYAVGVASRSLENPTEDDIVKVKRIFRYLRGTVSHGIKYQADSVKGLEAYSDADHAGDLATRRSTTGVICCFAEGAVSWFSQRQASVSISTTEAEIVASSEAARELVWLKRLFADLTQIDKTRLFVDNEAAIKLAHNPEMHRRTKHIETRHFYVRECVQENLLEVERISSQDQLADIMTKPLFKPRFRMLCQAIGLSQEDVCLENNGNKKGRC